MYAVNFTQVASKADAIADIPPSVITNYDPASPAVMEDPYPHYTDLRTKTPIAYSVPCGFWVVSRYADVTALLADPHGFSSACGVGPVMAPGIPMMLTSDPPLHDRLRCLVGRAFARHSMEQLEPSLRAATDHLLEQALSGDGFDAMSELAVPLTLLSISLILGVGADRGADLRRWSCDTFNILSGNVSDASFLRYNQSWREFKAYMLPHISARCQSPTGDLLSVLCASHREADGLSMSQVLNFALLLLAAGNQTTSDLIGNTLLALVERPEVMAQLRRDPALIPRAIDEVLRFDAPVQGLFRTTTRPMTVSGVTIPAHSKVMLLYGSANRDPEQFADPEVFDLSRSPNRHVAFGLGIHRCLGTQLARLEAQVALQAILRKTSHLSLDADVAPARQNNPLLRGLTRLPLRIERT